jgi:hypothetical protein
MDLREDDILYGGDDQGDVNKYDARNAVVRARAGTRPTVRVSVREFAALNKPGAKVGVTWKLVQGKTTRAVAQPQVALGADGWVTFRLTAPLAKRTTYSLLVDANDVNGLTVHRSLTLKGI